MVSDPQDTESEKLVRMPPPPQQGMLENTTCMMPSWPEILEVEDLLAPIFKILFNFLIPWLNAHACLETMWSRNVTT